jgi:hypothetical protein
LICDNFLHGFAGTPSARQADRPQTGSAARTREHLEWRELARREQDQPIAPLAPQLLNRIPAHQGQGQHHHLGGLLFLPLDQIVDRLQA